MWIDKVMAFSIGQGAMVPMTFYLGTITVSLASGGAAIWKCVSSTVNWVINPDHDYNHQSHFGSLKCSYDSTDFMGES